MQYDIQNQQALAYEMTINKNIEYVSQMSNMTAEEGDIEKILKELAVLQQQVAVMSGEIRSLQTDVQRNTKDIKELQERL